MNLVDACALKSGENSSPSAGVHHLGPLLLRRKRRARRWALATCGTARVRTKIRAAQATSIAYNIGVPREVGGETHTLMSSPGPRPRGGMMPRNDTWRGRDAHQGLAKGLGPWRVGWSGRRWAGCEGLMLVGHSFTGGCEAFYRLTEIGWKFANINGPWLAESAATR